MHFPLLLRRDCELHPCCSLSAGSPAFPTLMVLVWWSWLCSEATAMPVCRRVAVSGPWLLHLQGLPRPRPRRLLRLQDYRRPAPLTPAHSQAQCSSAPPTQQESFHRLLPGACRGHDFTPALPVSSSFTGVRQAWLTLPQVSFGVALTYMKL